jgi:hypothetical protein
VLKALKGCEWISLTQLASILANDISPECAIRFYLYNGEHCRVKMHTIDIQIALGRRIIISKKMDSPLRSEYAIRKYINGEQYYKLTSKGMKRHEEYEARLPKP